MKRVKETHAALFQVPQPADKGTLCGDGAASRRRGFAPANAPVPRNVRRPRHPCGTVVWLHCALSLYDGPDGRHALMIGRTKSQMPAARTGHVGPGGSTGVAEHSSRFRGSRVSARHLPHPAMRTPRICRAAEREARRGGVASPEPPSGARALQPVRTAAVVRELVDGRAAAATVAGPAALSPARGCESRAIDWLGDLCSCGLPPASAFMAHGLDDPEGCHEAVARNAQVVARRGVRTLLRRPTGRTPRDTPAGRRPGTQAGRPARGRRTACNRRL